MSFPWKRKLGPSDYAEVSTYNEAARLYGLAATPESVLRLTQLVSRQDAEWTKLAALITSDPALRPRMLVSPIPAPKAKRITPSKRSSRP